AIHVVGDRRFVDNGKIITAAGLSAGIDGALHVVEVMLGPGAAQQVALAEEYDWRPSHGFVRAALADMRIPDLDMEGFGDWTIAPTRGDADHGERVAKGITDRAPNELIEHVSRILESKGRWTRVNEAGVPRTRHWTFKGRDDSDWTGTFTLRDE